LFLNSFVSVSFQFHFTRADSISTGIHRTDSKSRSRVDYSLRRRLESHRKHWSVAVEICAEYKQRRPISEQ